MERLEEIRTYTSRGYNIELMWECQLNRELKVNKEMREFFANCNAKGIR